jgi:hypothetical protein
VAINSSPYLNPSQLLQYAQNAGFQGADAQRIAAIALAESGGRPSVINNNPQTGDNSYGLTQVNMIGSLGPARLKEFGLKNANQLLDPQTNFNAAKKIRDSSGWNAWTTNNTPAFKQALGQVQKAAGGPMSQLPSATNPTTTTNPSQQTQPGNTYNIYMSGGPQEAQTVLGAQDFLSGYLPKVPTFNQTALLSSIFASPEYG